VLINLIPVILDVDRGMPLLKVVDSATISMWILNMPVAHGRTLNVMWALVGLAWANIVGAAATPAPLGDPQFGPLDRNPQPLILISDVRNPKSYGEADLIASLMTSISDGNYAKKAARTAADVRTAAPTLDVQQLMTEAFHCGSETSMCTELAMLGELAPKQSVDDAARVLLEARQWNKARLLAVWWDGSDGLTTHVSLREVTLTDSHQLESARPILVGYVIAKPLGAEDPMRMRGARIQRSPKKRRFANRCCSWSLWRSLRSVGRRTTTPSCTSTISTMTSPW
jgi:hypothetical protein